MEQAGGAENLTGNELVMALNKMEDEHLRLQRQFRMIQTDRNNRTVGVHPQFRRQDRLLNTLKMEYSDLILNLKIARSGAHKKKDKKMKRDLKSSLLLIMKSVTDSENAAKVIDQLTGLIHFNVKDVLELRGAVTESNGKIDERRTQSEQRLVSTENKLETAMRRFNVVQHENKLLRDEIEHMLKDRAEFNKAWTKMLTALGKGKKFLTDLFESSTVAYDQRDEWVTKLRGMQEKGIMEQMLQVQEMRELQTSLDMEMRLYSFLSRKGMMRVNKQQEMREQELKLKLEEDAKRQLDNEQKNLEIIYEHTQMHNIQDIINQFENTEFENYSRYKLLTEFCAENVVLSRELKKLHQVVLDRDDWNKMMSMKRDTKLIQLQQELDSQVDENEHLTAQLEEKTKMVDENLAQIGEIFKMLDCSLEPFQNFLGDKSISIWQLNLTLNIITEKIKELVQTVCFNERQRHHMKSPTSPFKSRLKKYVVRVVPPVPWTHVPLTDIVTADPCPTCMEARWMSRVSEQNERPLTPAEARDALAALRAEPAYERSDRLHPLADCRLPRSRLVLARRYA